MNPRILDEDEGQGSYSMAWQGAGIAFVFIASLIGISFSYYLAMLSHKKQNELDVQHCDKPKVESGVLSDNLTLEEAAPDHMHGAGGVHNHDINTGKHYLSGGLDALLIFLKGVGVGIIISVALVHLINEAYEPLTDAGWIPENEGDPGYESWPMAIAIIGIYFMGLIEFIASTIAEREYETQLAATTAVELAARDLKKRKRIATMVEASILSHSILIGLDLGLQDHEGWQTLVIAICFHQFFEGIALAQVVGDAKRSKLSAALILLGYCLITPVGIGIGMGIMSSLPDGESEEYPQWANGLIGFIDSLAGGVLLYVGLLNLLLPWFLESKQLKHSKTSILYITIGWFGIALGLAIMCVIGIWA